VQKNELVTRKRVNGINKKSKTIFDKEKERERAKKEKERKREIIIIDVYLNAMIWMTKLLFCKIRRA
jgi:hypothetical protein